MSDRSTASALRIEHERVIPAQLDAVWRALTDSDEVEQYYMEMSVECSWMPGAPLTYTSAAGDPMIVGEILDVDEPHRLVHSFCFTKHGYADAADAGDRPTRVTWTLEPEDERTRITLTHDGFEAETLTFQAVEDGWETILDGLVLLFQDEV